MKKEKLLKIISIVTIVAMLLVMATNVFAADDIFDDVTDDGLIDLNGGTSTTPSGNTNTNINTNTNTNTNTNVNTNTNNYNTNLPNTGVAENTTIGVAITVLAIVSVFAYRKVKYYKDI